MTLKPSLSLRARIVLLVISCTLPALGILVYENFQERVRDVEVLRNEAYQALLDATGEQRRVFLKAIEVAETLSRLGAVRSGPREACDQALRQVMADQPILANIGVVARDGLYLCSGTEAPEGLTASGEALEDVRSVIASGKTTIGHYRVGPVVKRGVIFVSTPVRSAEGEPKASLFVAIDLQQLNLYAERSGLPDGFSLGMFDPDGTVISRHPDPERWIGTKYTDEKVLKVIRETREGAMEVAGLDGIKRLFAYGPLDLGDVAGGDVYVAVGFPLSTVYEPANGRLMRNIALMAIAVAATALFAAVMSELLLRKKFRPVLKAVREFADGNHAVRAERVGVKEFDDLVAAFNDMAISVQARVEERDAAVRSEREKADAFAKEHKETERLLKLAIDRELKMVELKKRIDKGSGDGGA